MGEQKSLILEMEEAKMEIIGAINNALQGHRLPAYIVAMILSEINSQVQEGAKNELAMAKEQTQTEKAE